MATYLTNHHHCTFLLENGTRFLIFPQGQRKRRVLISPFIKHLIPLSKHFLNTYCVHRPRHIPVLGVPFFSNHTFWLNSQIPLYSTKSMPIPPGVLVTGPPQRVLLHPLRRSHGSARLSAPPRPDSFGHNSNKLTPQTSTPWP